MDRITIDQTFTFDEVKQLFATAILTGMFERDGEERVRIVSDGALIDLINDSATAIDPEPPAPSPRKRRGRPAGSKNKRKPTSKSIDAPTEDDLADPYQPSVAD